MRWRPSQLDFRARRTRYCAGNLKRLLKIDFIDASIQSWLIASPPWFPRDQQPAERALCAAVWIL
jgi:hypothetical protein